MVLDHHVHTQFGDHPYIDAFDIAQLAREVGISILGFAENFPLPPSFADRVEDESYMPVEDFEHYVDTARGVRAEWSADGMGVLVGTEVDYLPGYRRYVDAQLERHTRHLDFVALAVHFLGDYKITFSRTQLLECREEDYAPDDRDGPVRDYYGLLLAGVETGMFDMVAHLDIIKKFDERSGRELAERFARPIGAVLDAMAATGHMALELNTSGLDMYCREPFPNETILREALRRGIPLTLGSDANSRRQAGRHFDRARELLDRLGVTELAYFKKRTRKMLPITEWLAASRDDAPAA